MRKRKTPKISEAEYAEVLIKHFEDEGYEVFKEVVGPSKIRADIYCKKGDETIAVEIKTTLNLKILEQSYRWKPYASKVYIAIPYSNYRHYKIAEEILTHFGIGVFHIYIDKRHGVKDLIVEKLQGAVNINPKEPMLCEEQKDSIAGTSGAYVTPFKITCAKLVKLIEENGPMPLKTATSMIDHHYKNDSSANQNLRKLITWGVEVLSTLELFKNGKSYGVRIKG